MRDLSEIERPPELTDGVVRLRAPLEKDRADTVRALNDETSARFLYKVPFPYTSADFDAWVKMCATAWGETRDAHWNIARADDDSYLGGASLMIKEDRQAGELGYQVVPWARGRGVAAAAARLLRDWGLDELGLERLEIHADVDNIGSQRVALALGMRHEGILRGYLTSRGVRRDHVAFGMEAHDPRERVVPLPAPALSDGAIVVRPFAPDDAEAVFRACQDPLIQQCCYFVTSPYTLEDAEHFMAEALLELTMGTTAHCAVCDAATGGLLGAVNLVHYPEREAGELGLWVVREARGRDVGTAALRLMIRYAFEQVGLERVEAMIETPNDASLGLVRKLGFTREGVLRGYLASRGERDQDLVDPAHGRIDQVMVSLLRPEWEAFAGRG
jgi:RimJ/RimL family protein N-acetyltransferase